MSDDRPRSQTIGVKKNKALINYYLNATSKPKGWKGESKRHSDVQKKKSRFDVKMPSRLNVGRCPFCNAKNNFDITEEDYRNNFDFSCDSCGKESSLWNYNLKEVR